MLNALGPVYNTLFEIIHEIAGDDLGSFERGFWYKEDCTQEVDSFPYAFLDQPNTTEVQPVSSPLRFGYQIEILFVALTYKADQSGLYFNQTNAPQATGAVELVHSISQQVWDLYLGGLPFQPRPVEWRVINWTLGRVRRPNLPELDDYFKNKYVAGASIPFIFTVHEDSPLQQRR